jgi:hypothetical protein
LPACSAGEGAASRANWEEVCVDDGNRRQGYLGCSSRVGELRCSLA